MTEPLRLPVRVSDVALLALSNVGKDKPSKLWNFLGATSERQTDAIGREGLKELIDAIYDGRLVLNPETDEEFIKRLKGKSAIWPNDAGRLIKLAEKALKGGD
jgi:hypothetical protein